MNGMDMVMERVTKMMGISPEGINQQIEAFRAGAQQTFQHFDARMTILDEKLTALSRDLGELAIAVYALKTSLDPLTGEYPEEKLPAADPGVNESAQPAASRIAASTPPKGKGGKHGR